MSLLEINAAGYRDSVSIAGQNGHVWGSVIIWSEEHRPVMAGVVTGPVVFDSSTPIHCPLITCHVSNHLEKFLIELFHKMSLFCFEYIPWFKLKSVPLKPAGQCLCQMGLLVLFLVRRPI